MKNSAPPARLLDLTRLISRAGRVATGVDRVELAYLDYLMQRPDPLFAVVRTTLGFVLLDRKGVMAVQKRLSGQVNWGMPDRLSRLARSKSPEVRRAESDLRRHALDRCLPRGLFKMLARHLPKGSAYLNVGHSNLTDRMFQSVRHGLGGRTAIMIHDVIPLEFPQFQRPGTPEKFRQMLKRVRAQANVVIYNTSDTRDRAERYMEQWGPPPKGVVAHLGVNVGETEPEALPAGLIPSEPYFVTLGTIEPRKGHDMLLDIWENWENGSVAPGLLICGSRGWNNDAVFARLDALPKGGPIRELQGLEDGAIAALLKGSSGLLCPSHAEGFGLPAAEAAALGVPVVCSDLPAFREVLGDYAVYAAETDRYQWRNRIQSLIKGRGEREKAGKGAEFIAPTWADHFNTVLKYT
ncbi:glycosyltransferase family 4 protein [Seohaeicola saemankumensis]|nr:glycosyltransferase family 1 protein [Seohaeicola saemankumensis]MCA0870483.1 glycosyltransferase family 4 protein [Seohaeicola saemankumensis]